MAPHQTRRLNQSSDDYCAYITSMEKKTSMCEGPHFPNLQNMFREEKPKNQKPKAQEKMLATTGRFGRAEHIEYEISGTSCEDEAKVYE
ncbi:uncharacterized protein A4U43_C02F20650 [Asparagus officinalis]|uniref:Uncharacterized protein n=1 Tax=Asparagus officinalis TaxID=4686 RepID=A0A5P1FKL9_ASPOF|nr:uncharacterized protein A4U43_C02F20650 [Asparagus officinalis]